jgi:hypothetical protein
VSEFLGITRERVYSPGKIDADRAILEAVAAGLRAEHRVRVVSADDPLPAVGPDTTAFVMCQGPGALRTLRDWQRSGVRVVNSPEAIENCHRSRMFPAFERHGILHPPGMLVATDQPAALAGWVDGGAWLKRGDVHATEPDDVVQVQDRAAARAALDRMQERGIESALVQRHVDGDVIKFYAVTGLFFACFPSAGATIDLDARVRAAMVTLVQRGAVALGLEVFGGDCIRDRRGRLWLVDLNDWPSYAPCQAAAASAIATYLRTQRESSVA